MKALDALNIINDLASSQKGLFTAAQATALGVDRMSLSRLAAHGQIEPVARGVFKAAAAPSIRGEDVYAAWLATDPTSPAYLRPPSGNVCVASLGTAAWLHGLGELKPEPITFSYPDRKQTRNLSVHFLRRSLPADDVCIAEGIPTTTPRRTILDLLDYGEDLSLVAAALRDVGLSCPAAKIRDEVNSRAGKCGFDKGFDLYAYLRRA
jgi:predicted transcriptional regulator of viral defense system